MRSDGGCQDINLRANERRGAGKPLLQGMDGIGRGQRALLTFASDRNYSWLMSALPDPGPGLRTMTLLQDWELATLPHTLVGFPFTQEFITYVLLESLERDYDGCIRQLTFQAAD